MPTFLIPFVLRLVTNTLSNAVTTHSAASDYHQKAANAHQSAAEQSTKLLTALLAVLNG